MLTRNWYNQMATQMTGAKITNGITRYDGTKATSSYQTGNTTSYIDERGNSVFYHARSVVTSTPIYTNTSGILFGTGDTPPTLDDYKLAGNIVTGITAQVSTSYEIEDEGNGVSAVVGLITYLITNNNSTEITIKELCVLGYCDTGSNSQTGACFDRTVLDTPLTIQPGSIGQLQYRVRAKIPTA